MPNNTDSNITQKIAKGFKPGFDASTVLLNTVDTQTLPGAGLGMPEYGESVKFKRPMQFRSTKTTDGDITGATPNSLIFGSSKGTIQDFYTVDVEWSIIEEALRLNELESALKPISEQIVSDIEVDLGTFMINNSGLTVGGVGTPVTTWKSVSEAGSMAKALGVPAGDLNYVMNPFSQSNLADVQQGLASGSNDLVDSAWKSAQITSRVAGLRTLSSTSLSSYQAGALANATGTVSATPTATYLAAKDTYTQTVVLTGLTNSTTDALRPGDTVEFTDNNRSYINLRTRRTIMGSDGLPIKWRGTVMEAASTDGSGNATVVLSPAAIFETGGQFNNISSPITTGDAFKILGAADTEYQPNLFYHKAAFGVGFVKIPKLHSTDTVMTMKNGVSIRISRYADGKANSNMVRFDALPAFACFNPLFAGRAWG